MKKKGQNLTERVLKTIRSYDMLKPGDVVIAAVSGGPDSVFLLHAMAGLKNKLKLKEIIVCNLDHGLRGKESRDDSIFVKRLAKQLSLRFAHKKINLSRMRSKGLSTEELAREARYGFFKETASRFGANVVATGHTLDDQAETIMMRIVLGSSIKGLAGIFPVRKVGRLTVIRPLMELEKDEITDYLEDSDISYRVDRTNLERLYFRNVVRSEILPFLEKYNPRLKRSLSNMAGHLRDDLEFIGRRKDKAGEAIRHGHGGSADIGLKDIIPQPKAVQKELLRDLLERSGGLVKRLSFRHWKEMENLISSKPKGSSIDLPGNIRVTRTATALTFRKRT